MAEFKKDRLVPGEPVPHSMRWRWFGRRHKPGSMERYGFWGSRWFDFTSATFYFPRLYLWQVLWALGVLDAEARALICYRYWPRYAQWPWITWRYRMIGARGTLWQVDTPWKALKESLRPPTVYR